MDENQSAEEVIHTKMIIITTRYLSQLTKVGKSFKYMGLHTASSCFWDNSIDGSCMVPWDNKSIYCIVSVFGLAI
uniref:Dynein light chain n=1 Tax=Cyprinus carpio TaxID=7962 RepID=A0A8C2F676_CYPCA